MNKLKCVIYLYQQLILVVLGLIIFVSFMYNKVRNSTRHTFNS